MSLGILNNVSAIYAENNLNNTQSSLQNVLQQLSSGARINSGADDAAGLAIANGLKANENALTQSAQNASDGINLLNTADGALSQVTNLLDRAVTLATEAANGTLSTAQVSSANSEYQSILSEIGNIGSTTNFNGTSVFSSTATTFYVGDGTASGANVFNDAVGSLSASNVGNSAPSAASAIATLTVGSGVALGATGVNTITFAAPTDTIQGTFSITAAARNGGTAFSTTFAAGTTFTQAVAQLQSVLPNGYTTGGVASTGVITITDSSSEQATGAGTSISDFQGTAPVTFGTATANASAGGAAAVVITSGLRQATDLLSGTLNIALTGGNSASLSQTFNGATLSQAAALVNSNQSFISAGVTATVSGSTLHLSGPTPSATAGYTITGTVNNLTDSPVANAPNAGTNLSGTAVSTLGASTLLTSLNSAIANVSYQRGILGADSNQLTAAANTAASENVNLTSAESSIRSTNYGEATSDLAKFEVLSQTGISALAQANSVQQEILKLLQ